MEGRDHVHRMRLLVSRHRLGNYHNPGGVEFFSSHAPAVPHCQICNCPGSEDEDYATLLAWAEKYKNELSCSIPTLLIQKSI